MPLPLDALHDALDAAGAEVIGASFHDEAVDADNRVPGAGL